MISYMEAGWYQSLNLCGKSGKADKRARLLSGQGRQADVSIRESCQKLPDYPAVRVTILTDILSKTSGRIHT